MCASRRIFFYRIKVKACRMKGKLQLDISKDILSATRGRTFIASPCNKMRGTKVLRTICGNNFSSPPYPPCHVCFSSFLRVYTWHTQSNGIWPFRQCLSSEKLCQSSFPFFNLQDSSHSQRFKIRGTRIWMLSIFIKTRS